MYKHSNRLNFLLPKKIYEQDKNTIYMIKRKSKSITLKFTLDRSSDLITNISFGIGKIRDDDSYSLVVVLLFFI
ncbi:hypothetical protein BpHYR1_002499 [Brachionus plicatilis]|uniref:Uncharacterized protein n=1 Tax=Brachionus plicatilis TaxID=10195 RepID=A0A3M7QSW9_BRAPC|nr:hypothetical protein BpHYR1_002499 [Brachionus plicatilis]